MADRVAGKAPHSQKLNLGRLIGTAECCNIGLAKAVDLAGADQRVASAAPDIVENPGEPHPVLIRLAVMRAHTTHRVGR